MTGSNPTIAEADPQSDDALELLKRHLKFTQENSPPGTCFAFDSGALAVPEVTFWLARVDDKAVGCAALLARADGLAEVKSIHVLDTMRGSGLGQALVETAIAKARELGATHIVLETGRSDGFAASRRLYERLGFEVCPAFPPYEDGTFSYCMKQEL
jgi:putative acetyltransferase